MDINLTQAIDYLKKGKVVAVPTETVYGLAASLHHESAIEQIFVLKGRPRNNPLIIHVDDIEVIKTFVTEFPPNFFELAEVFWPGPMTLILSVQTKKIPSIVRANLETAGFRIPNHPMTLKLLHETGPLVMPSANISGRPSSTSLKHVGNDFGKAFPVLDGGLCEKGLESTILFFEKDHWVILRQGSLSSEVFVNVLGYAPKIVLKSDAVKPLCPGQLFRHYAPKAKLFLGDSQFIEEASFVIGFREHIYPKEKKIIYLGSLSSPEEVAENLYKVLRLLDEEKAISAWVDMDFPYDSLWATIRERLNRAGE